MEFHLNEKKVREMAGRMRRVFGNDTLGHSKALEAVAQTLGYPNWDTLSGLLKRAEEPGFKLDKPVTLYVNAFSCDEWGEGPTWCKLTIDQHFIDTVLELQALCKAKGLDQTTKSWGVDAWGQSDSLNLRDEDLAVGKHSWWIRARPKHADYDCETRMLDIGWLLEALGNRTSTEYLAWRKDVLLYDSASNIKGMVEELVDNEELDESYLDELADNT